MGLRTKQITVCDALKVEVNCAENDAADIRCGGPRYLGFDFYINPAYKTKYVKRIRELLDKYGLPCLEIHTYERRDYDVNKLWTLERIEKEIRTNKVC